MAVLYKLTDDNDRTFGGTQWGEGVEHIADGRGDLCTSGWIHAYTDPLLAVLLNPIHAAFADPHLWVADGDVGKSEHGLKVGCTRLRTLRRIALPTVTAEQRVRFAILCALEVYHSRAWRQWAEGWLLAQSGGKAEAAAWAAEAAAWAAWAARAAEAAARAAEAAAWAAWAARAAEAAWAAAWAAWAAEAAARAAEEDSTWNITSLAKRAVEEGQA